MYETKGHLNSTHEAHVPLEHTDISAEEAADILHMNAPTKGDSEGIEDLLSCIEKWQNNSVGGPSWNKQVSMSEEPSVSTDEKHVGLIGPMVYSSQRVQISPMNKAQYEELLQSYYLRASSPPNRGEEKQAQPTSRAVEKAVPVDKVPHHVRVDQLGEFQAAGDRSVDTVSEKGNLPQEEGSFRTKSRTDSASTIDEQSVTDKEVIASIPKQFETFPKVDNEIYSAWDSEPPLGLHELPSIQSSSVPQLQRPFKPNGRVYPECQGNGNDIASFRFLHQSNLHLGNGQKRRPVFFDRFLEKPRTYRKGTPGLHRPMPTSSCPDNMSKSTASGPPSRLEANVVPDLKFEPGRQLSSSSRCHDSSALHSITNPFTKPFSPSLPFAGDDGTNGRPNLVYLGSLESLSEERLSDCEENPFLHYDKEPDAAVITPRDILIYGRRGSVHEGDGPFLSSSDPQGSLILKDISLKSQVNQIRNLGNRIRRPVKERVPPQQSVEAYAQMAAQFEKIRGVCYCRSDNSWTAWWTDRGRNRKKAFKVSRFGFNEARRLAIEHRQSIYQKSSVVSDKRASADAASDVSLGSGDVTPREDHSGGSTTPVSSPVISSVRKRFDVSRMQTRRSSARSFPPASKEDLVATVSDNHADSGSGDEAGDEFFMSDVATPRLGYSADLPLSDTAGFRLSEDFPVASKVVTDAKIDVSVVPETTVQSPEYGSCGLSPAAPVPLSLNRELFDLMKLDQHTSTSVEAAISNLASTGGTTRLPSGEAVQVLPQVSSGADGKNVTVILIMRPDNDGHK
ncbi:uncharacterized protein BXIN_1848 [Babesia sp. Xinjiang]|uniref:uncharacterized protein n=1 Tax=Babesia sp. Xinjiang TaxID=462227 RepID=UPI000A23F1FA|nr:uncharacterized protein BXIN_1848 [Babesia sp. Xinjiang]ORM40465.1 hypothetical protein BXIN_1848 [Babesia sp. Xinjiang]